MLIAGAVTESVHPDIEVKCQGPNRNAADSTKSELCTLVIRLVSSGDISLTRKGRGVLAAGGGGDTRTTSKAKELHATSLAVNNSEIEATTARITAENGVRVVS